MLSSAEVPTGIKTGAKNCCFLLKCTLTCMCKHNKKVKSSKGSVAKWLGHLTGNLEVGGQFTLSN